MKSIGLVFDRVRFEEKAIIEKSKEKGLSIKLSDA
ncbi:MAG: lysine biosynthesis enzyme LysX, partial [archaeon]|nr:lysine biosynthesis enzyme LysX [archaeon]